MTYITKHDTEKEGEGYNGKDTWVYLFVGRNTICVNDFLEDPCDLVQAEMCWWFDPVVIDYLECRNLNIYVSILQLLYLLQNVLIVESWNPAEPKI